jgi:glycyl-tRNA synthetase beta chain
MMSRDLILEIGTEEIPASYLPPALKQIQELAKKELTAQRIAFGETKAFATPRRIVLHVTDVAEAQESSEQEMVGPAKSVAFDADGNPTKAGEGFARGQGVSVEDLKIIETDKGEYVAVTKKEESQATAEILPEIMPGLITTLHFPKMQRWGYTTLRFPRPIRWIMCLYGADVVPFGLEGLESGRSVRGHRFLAPGPFDVKDTGEYYKVIKDAKVVLDQEERRKIIREGLDKAAKGVKGQVIGNEELVEEVTYLVEYPVVLLGTFEDRYLSLPWEVLITSMSSHQRYFSVTDKKGQLMPHFITVSNTITEDDNVVIKGNERVLRARLEDGMFFFAEDRKVPLAQRVEELKDVVFQEKLGTSWEKMERFSALADYIAGKVAPDSAEEVKKVAFLCKGDLVTQMVGEFASLQGVMGKEYALLEGEDKDVAQGILDHYLPRQSGGETPETIGGAIVSIADRLDTVAGCFGIGITPTGTADPYGLRRHTLAIMAILQDRGWRISLQELMAESMRLLDGKIDHDPAEAMENLAGFMKGRLLNQFTGKGARNDLVQAVLESHWDDPVDAAARLEALTAFSQEAGFADLMLSFKRVMNIIPEGFSGSVDEKLLSEDAGKPLAEAAGKIGSDATAKTRGGDYLAALKSLAGLKGPVDNFFDNVMVMDKDEKVKNNRLALLAGVSDLFAQVADFRKIVTE